MTFATEPRARRIILGGALALSVVFVAGAIVQMPRTQDDLARRVESSLAASGITAKAEFSGQDGTLTCVDPLADVEQALTLARNVWGVRAIDAAQSCSAGGSSVTTTSLATTVASTAPPSTTAPSSTAPSSTTPATTAPTATSPATTTTEPAAAMQFTVGLENGQLGLEGAVANDLERFVLVDRAANTVAPGNLFSTLTIDPRLPAVPGPQFDGVLALMVLMPNRLVDGQLSWNGSSVALNGTYATEADRAAMGAAAASVGVAATLTPRLAATPSQAAALEAELNALVAAQPILFDKGSTDISSASLGTVQQVAGIAKRYDSVAIEVQGHTDSEGDPGRNLTLSEQRAASVRDALVLQGVPAADVTFVGFGMTQLITDSNGIELPEKSRRVVFGVTTT